MMHRHNNNLFNRRNNALIAIVAISAFALLYSPLRGPITEMTSSVAINVWDIGNTSGGVFSSIVSNFKSNSDLQAENETLRSEVSHMQVQVLDRNLLEEKVSMLEEMLGRTYNDNRVVANVLTGPGISPYDTLVVDVGSNHGVKVGDKVVYSGSGVVGNIIELTSVTSKLKLYSSPGEERNVLIGSSYTPALAVGRGMGNFETKVPQDSNVFVGDSVILPGGNLIIGTVSLSEEKPSLPFKRVLFRVPFNISEMRSVEIIKEGE